MASTRVIKFPANDQDSESVIVQVKSHGRRSLDLRLVGTEKHAPYLCILKHNDVASLCVKNCPVSVQEWEHVLEAVLRGEHLDGIHTTATVHTKSSLSLTVRKQVQGVTQRLGIIEFACDQKERIQLYDWCDTALDALAESKAEAQASAARARELEAAVSDLQTQLNELVETKQQDETALLCKFRDLLNEKKVKIREQQKIITATVSQRDEPSCSQPEAKIKSEPSPEPNIIRPGPRPARRSAPSRRTKRKAKSPPVDSDGSSDHVNEPSSEEAQETDSSYMSAGTASTAGSDGNDDRKDTVSAPGSGQTRHQTQGQMSGPKNQVEKPPEPRRLPFTKSNTAATNVAEDETDSDDEL
ncbi:hypothetical protein CDD82_317 [Ophiocordyceps australis]|uniref:XRCC4 coiled-coil domain-containing protein n=1 Tax=Ophiocordyceps australis TaxID=1399860 RepID=A0A2C5ZQC4_9HYPO|nr:hypothetical protein CDD82_317 [Ophiocordyceps australis]